MTSPPAAITPAMSQLPSSRLPVLVLIQPSTKGLTKPPIRPRLLMKAMPPAAAAPLR